MAKLQSTAERIRKVNHLKEKWAKEKEEKTQRNRIKKVTDLRKVQDDNSAAAASRKKVLEAQKSYADREKEEQRELLSASVEARTQLAKDMDEKCKAKRRISVFLNNSIRKKAVEREETIRRAEKDQSSENFQLRRTDVLQNRQAKMADEMKRRESMAYRGVTAKLQREVEAQMVAEERDEVSELIKTRHMNWEDDRHSKQTADQQRRMSVAHRLDEWRDQKKVVEQTAQSQKQFDRNLLHTQKLDHDDVLGYKAELIKRDRMSLAGRLQKWREERVDPAIQAAADAIERELQQCGFEDVQAYRATLKQQRRESVAHRVDKARRDKGFEAGQKALARVVRDEEQRLQDYDHQDVTNYRKGLQDARRQSLHYRNVKESEDRQRVNGEKQSERDVEAANRAMDAEAWNDVRAYQEQLRQDQRKSIAGRIAHSQHCKAEDLEQHRVLLDAMHRDFELSRLDHLEMREFREEEAVRGRRSIALRLASWKHDKLAAEKERFREQVARDEDALLQEQDREELHAAKLAFEMMQRCDLLSSSEMKH